MSIFSAVLAAILLGIGCGDGQTAMAGPHPRMSVPSEAEPAIAQARADAALRTGVEPGRWRPVEVVARQWPDSGLGCPEPGKVYAQVVTAGFLIRLEADGRRLVYHSGGGRVVYCSGG
jgi:hypothetical protein